MLMLSRRIGETVIIGEDIAITIMEIHGGQVRLGIKAPRQVAVHREEIYQRLAQDGPDKVISFAK